MLTSVKLPEFRRNKNDSTLEANMAARGSVAMRVVSWLDVQSPGHLQSQHRAGVTDQLPAELPARRPSGEVRSKFALDRWQRHHQQCRSSRNVNCFKWRLPLFQSSYSANDERMHRYFTKLLSAADLKGSKQNRE